MDLVGLFGQQLATGAVGQILKMMWMAFKLIGAAVVIFGAVQIGFAFKNDDADGKTKGMRAAISGAIVLVVGIGADMLMMSMTS